MIQSLRILLLGDDPLVHTTLRLLLATTVDLALVGETANVAVLTELCTQTKPHILLLGGGNASLIHEVALLAQQACPQTRVVALLNSTDPHPLSSTPLAGYCFKDEINESILHLLRAIAAGATWVSGGVAARLCAQASELSYTHPHADLTPVEQEVYVLLGRGWSNGQIVAHLHCTEQTVRNYSSRIYKKLGINRAELIVQFQSNLKKS